MEKELEKLLEYVPVPIRNLALEHDLDGLEEIVLDLGRPPQLRWRNKYVLLNYVVGPRDLELVVGKTGEFRSDNRAGIPGTLHRISALRNRYGDIVGFTLRVGRHLVGAASPLARFLKSGASVLLVGPPGAGKTTILRDAARVLADEVGLRVVVVDTSNEIGGDGDIPHPAIGTARRLQVPDPSFQYRVMLEAVKNHTPEAIVIDEIGTAQEAEVARSIAARGVRLIATAHGFTVADIIRNPDLNQLVGSPRPLGGNGLVLRPDERGILIRTHDPAFTVAVELSPDHTARVHPDLARSIDCILRGDQPPVEHVNLRRYTPAGDAACEAERMEGRVPVQAVPASGTGLERREVDPWSL